MPLYRFHLDVNLSSEAASERLQFVTLEPPGFFKYFCLCWFSSEPSELFIGKVQNGRFNIRCLHMRYRNMFLPRVRGVITASKRGSHIDVLMYMNPFAAAFVACWFFTCGKILFVGYTNTPIQNLLGGLAIFIVGCLFSLGSFVDGTLKTKKMLTCLWLGKDTKILVDTSSHKGKVKCSSCGHLNTINCSKCLYCGADIASV
jgi:hypothetical protein